MSLLVLQSSRWGRESWYLSFLCIPGVLRLFCGSSSLCHRFVCSLWLWYFLIIFTIYYKTKCHIWYRGSTHYVGSCVHNKKSNIQGRSLSVIKVIFHTIRNCSKRKESAPSGSKFFLLREVLIWKGTQLKRIIAWSSSLPLMCVTSAFWLRSCL